MSYEDWLPATFLDALEVDSAMHIDLAGHSVRLVRTIGGVHALLDECSHGQVALSDGEVEGEFIECWLHGSRFDLTSGAPTGPPATTPIEIYPVRVVSGVIEVALPSRASGPR